MRMRCGKTIFFVVVSLGGFFGTAGAQLPRPDESRTGAAIAVGRTGPITIDGYIREADWARAAPATNFVQRVPVEGNPADNDTEVRVLYDDDALYVAARLYDAEPSRISQRLTRRDEMGQFDFFIVSLDPNRDRRTGYSFQISAAGVQADYYLFDDVRVDSDWDAVWQSAVQTDSLGWTAELRIPLSQIRIDPADSVQTWGANFSRRRVASNERTYWSLESDRIYGQVSRFRPLTGLLIREAPRRLELRPYVLARGRTAPTKPGDPFFDGREAGASVGGDVRWGLGTFTLDATVNPDFGQVEVDPEVINLSAFETFFPERRPFFVEDARIFDFRLSGGGNSLFYSRRVGREPTLGGLAGAEFADVPPQTAILGAAKLTGRTSGGLALGALAAVTDRATARAYFPAADSVAFFLAEPRSYHGVLRARQDFGGGRSQLGGIVTALRRDLPADGAFNFLPRQAFSAGIDGEHTWANRAWALWGFLAATHVQGEPGAITRLQRSSSHYFQRPDAVGLGVDSAATSLTGAEWRLQLEKRSGEHWTGGVWLAERTAGFDANDLGYFRGGERLDGGARLVYREITPGPLFRSYRLSAVTFNNWRHEALRDPWSWSAWGAAHKAGGVFGSADVEFLNYWSLELGARFSPETFSDNATRGGPLLLEPATWSFSARGRTDRRRPFVLEPQFEWQPFGLAGGGWNAGFGVTLRPSDRVELEVEPRYERGLNTAQYVTATGNVGYIPTFGRRYLFGDLRRETLSMDTRLNVSFSPDLTLQLFAQPLLSAGEYGAYKQFAAASTFRFDTFEQGQSVATEAGGIRCVGGRICRVDRTRYLDYDADGIVDFTFGDRDFRVRSLRGNAVLRWQYRPGSALFLVWQQGRYLQDADAALFRPVRDLGGLWALDAENVLMLKVSYWFGL